MEKHLEKYWIAVKSKLGNACIDRDPEGSGECRIPEDSFCAVEKFFPQIVETVLSVQSDSMDEYVEALRKNVCSICRNQTPDGKCEIRNSIECCLDRYYPLIVEAIESVR